MGLASYLTRHEFNAAYSLGLLKARCVTTLDDVLVEGVQILRNIGWKFAALEPDAGAGYVNDDLEHPVFELLEDRFNTSHRVEDFLFWAKTVDFFPEKLLDEVKKGKIANDLSRERMRTSRADRPWNPRPHVYNSNTTYHSRGAA